jgi:hypothetical protein
MHRVQHAANPRPRLGRQEVVYANPFQSFSASKPIRYIAGHLICAVNVGSALAERGIKGTGSARALSYLGWGRSAGGPVPGAVIVSARRRGGHVAIVSRVENAWRVQHLPDESVGFLNAVKKHFDQAAENSASKFNPARNKETQATHEMQASAVRQISEALSPDYRVALEIQRRGREQFLDPLLQGPLGRLAKKDMTTQRAIAALFPENPVPGTEGEIRNAVYPLAQQRPAVAEALVRAHVEMTFNQAARDLQGGANHFSGAKFAVKLAGGAQQRANLRAAIEALPNGAARWEGFERLLEIMEATGARQPKGSLTAFNQLEVQSMSTGGIQDLASKGLSPGKWMSFANDAFKGWSLGRNLDQLARILTSPDSGEALRNIVRIPAGSDRALMMAGRIIGTLGAATTDQRAKTN